MQEVVEGRQKQGIDEEICYKITTTNWGSNPTLIEVKAFVNEVDFTDAVFPVNSPSATGDVITLSAAKNLNAGTTYRVEVKFTVDSNVFECFFLLEGER